MEFIGLNTDFMKFSIVVPNYNYDTFVGKTIDSIIGQNYSNMELVVVDDGSTDNSLKVINSYRIKHPNFIKVVEQTNKGQSVAVNTGIVMATGDIFGWINSDDTYCKNTFHKVSNIFTNHPDVDVVFGNINVIDLNDHHIYTLKHFGFSYFLSVFTGFANNMSSNAVFWRRQSYGDLMLLNPNYKCGMDNELFSRLTYNKKVFHLNEPLANFRLQAITKAAIGNKDWQKIMKNESNKVFEQSFANLTMSRVVSPHLAKKIKWFFINYKRLLKMTTGMYLTYFFEKKRYKYNKKMQNTNR